MNASTCDTSTMNSREAGEFYITGEEGPTAEIILGAELIEVGESDEVVDLTSESLEPAVIDLTHHDSVVITEERRRPSRNRRSFQSQIGICAESSEKKGLTRNRDVNVTNSAHRSAPEKETLSCTLPGYIQCRICMDGYLEIEMSRQHIYSTECGHIFCSRCLCTFLQYTKNCPVCLKKIDRHQYHRIYI
ncbi:E3 ubiquitin-protein ligase RNF4-like [Phyllostomus hastatus]|uniref:E3 ubiquitin-protein ligase RNF4-like n=1 Tax=Phyllostomus hastatus TaxID=9423 RepID=UPI001E681C7F|nr:E3 ubiquitin-protein ligase RNF4-like [Phyllostomus hastatus]